MKTFFFLISVLFLFSCQNKQQPAQDEISPDYEQKFRDYRAELLESRRKNYLPLVGLTKMDSAYMEFGSNPQNSLHLQGDSIPETLGIFIKKDSNFKFVADNSLTIKNSNDSIVNNIFLPLDSFGSSDALNYKDITWQIITRNEQPYLRVWDFKSEALTTFAGFENYPLNQNLIFAAHLKYFPNKRSEKVDSQLGPKTSTQFLGSLYFEYNGKTYTLDFGEGGFIMVSDQTSGNETYGGGRYMYIDLPQNDSIVELDFNKLYNPPCAFNKYTTCLYPPRQNEMPFKITAGEKLKRIE